jgi:GNAT superfamily N-acetyltransferase
MLRWVTIYYLETHNPAELRRLDEGNHVEQLEIELVPASGKLNRRFYREVGADWNWTDRRDWTDDEWEEYAQQPGLDTCVAHVGEKEIGYFELDRQSGANVEIAYFGLLPAAIGRGLGRQMLVAAIERAWQLGAARVWVHTCTLDHPQALANYLARGMQLYKQESFWQDVSR